MATPPRVGSISVEQDSALYPDTASVATRVAVDPGPRPALDEARPLRTGTDPRVGSLARSWATPRSAAGSTLAPHDRVPACGVDEHGVQSAHRIAQGPAHAVHASQRTMHTLSLLRTISGILPFGRSERARSDPCRCEPLGQYNLSEASYCTRCPGISLDVDQEWADDARRPPSKVTESDEIIA